MKEKEALEMKNKLFFLSVSDDVHSFIKKLYKHGYIILTPEELNKVDAMTTLAEAHGMNPFKPKKD